MILAEFVIQKRLMEGNIKLAVERAIEKFQHNTGYCPVAVDVEMLDTTKYHMEETAQRQRESKVGQVKTVVDI